jgi:hypothetical protein
MEHLEELNISFDQVKHEPCYVLSIVASTLGDRFEEIKDYELTPDECPFRLKGY